MSHPIFTLFTALVLAIALAMVEDRTPRERLYVGVRMFASCVTAIIAGSWAMRLLHG